MLQLRHSLPIAQGEVMKIQAVITPKAGVPNAAFGPHLVGEERAVWASYEAGILREMYFQPDPVVVTLVFEATSKADVLAHLGDYPMVKAGLLDVEVNELGPWLPLRYLFGPQAS